MGPAGKKDVPPGVGSLGILVWQPGDVLVDFYPFAPARRIAGDTRDAVSIIRGVDGVAIR
jgi:hypothetical protein